MSDTRKPSNCQVEPPYPGEDTVVFALRAPDWTCHIPSIECPVDYPHRIEECNIWRGSDLNEGDHMDMWEDPIFTEQDSSTFTDNVGVIKVIVEPVPEPVQDLIEEREV